jgi:cell division protein FtsI/penicillin-binding protein 2
MPDRFVLRFADSLLGIGKPLSIANDPAYAAELTRYMKAQSAGKVKDLGLAVAGKTGTPERIIGGRRINDGWYVFFAPKAKGSGHIVVCVRIERTKGSSDAVKLAGRYVIPHLLRRGYIRSFNSAGADAKSDESRNGNRQQ